MKSKVFLAAGLTAMTLLSAFPTMTAFADTSSDFTCCLPVDAEKISPRYLYIESATISVHPNDSETVYILDIIGTSAITSVSGTATLYKQNSSGKYIEVDSEKLSFQGSTVDYMGYLASDGSGKYKIEFVGTIYTSNGKESVTFRNYSSY